MARKIPVNNTLDDDIFSSLGTTVSSAPSSVADSSQFQKTPAPAVTSASVQRNEVSEPVEMDFSAEVNASDESSPVSRVSESKTSFVSKDVKATQIVVRVSEKEKRELQSYFIKHGLSLSKGLKLAVRYLEMQEKNGNVRFSDVGIY